MRGFFGRCASVTSMCLLARPDSLPSIGSVPHRNQRTKENHMTPHTAILRSASESRPVSWESTRASVVLAGRILFSLIFIMAAFGHFLRGAIAYAASQGVPFARLAVPLSGVIAFAGGLSILLGYRAKVGAWLIVLFLAAVTPMLHNFWIVADPMMHQMQLIMFMKNVSILGGALLVTQLGAGPWSFDGRRR